MRHINQRCVLMPGYHGKVVFLEFMPNVDAMLPR